MSITRRILAAHMGRDVSVGELIECPADVLLGNDITGPQAIALFRSLGWPLNRRARLVLVADHFVPNRDAASAALAKTMREFASEQGIEHYYEVGRGGIEHALLPERGLVRPGCVILGADSHTTTYGALGAFATGVGSTDLAAAMATGELWLRVPEAVGVRLVGRLRPHVSGKDVALYLLMKLGVAGATYQALEFFGNVEALSLADRFTVCNMAAELGAKNAVFALDDAARAYVRARSGATWEEYHESPKNYETVRELDLGEIPLMVAPPHSPGNARPLAEAEGTAIDQAFIGSCTNGRIEDMRAAAAVLRGKKAHGNVRLVVIPATQEVYRQCMAEGLADVFVAAGAALCTPSCGPCLGGHMGVLAAGEVCVSTSNRNFRGRMGHVDAEVYLASPAVAAASAVAGKLCAPR